MIVMATSTNYGVTPMLVGFQNNEHGFLPWKPVQGRIFKREFAFDCETTPIDEHRPWIAPAYVLGAAFDGSRGFFVQQKDVAAFFTAHAKTPVVFHNAPFDLAVIHTLAPDLDIYEKVEEKAVWDTQLLHRLLVLGSAGHTARGRGESDLEHCAETYLGVRLPKDATDADGKLVRKSYGQWLNQDPRDIDDVYLEYLARDAIATWSVYDALRARLHDLLQQSGNVWGFVSPAWLDEQIEKWGPQTHHIQLRAAIVLREITANGLHLDLPRKEELERDLRATLKEQKASLRSYGYLAGGPGSNKSLQAILQRLEVEQSGELFPRTDTDLYGTSREALQDLADTVPFVRLLLDYRTTEKLLNSFLDKMCQSVLRPSFNVLATTGRTTSFGDLNAQNLPTDDRVRSCFVPSDDHVFLDADYKTIELATLAQACVAQFGLDSAMSRAINDGKDLHTLVAARVTGKNEAAVTKAERKHAKPINFGKPGGMGNATMKQYALTSYGVRLTDAQVEALSDAWFALFPEMRSFLGDTSDTPLRLAERLGLTLAAHYEHTKDDRLIEHSESASQQHHPSPVLGGMCLKVLREDEPRTRKGSLYTLDDLSFFWSRLASLGPELSPASCAAILDKKKQPSIRLQREVMALVNRDGVFTLTGRLRAAATYCARHNTVFQGLAADGAKLALWRLWRAGYRLANFVHDQVLVEVPADSNLTRHAKKVRRLMNDAMKEVVPDVKVDVSIAATDRWYKEAEAVYNRRGRLQLWRPKQTKTKIRAAY
jgi:hypothetical protein